MGGRALHKMLRDRTLSQPHRQLRFDSKFLFISLRIENTSGTTAALVCSSAKGDIGAMEKRGDQRKVVVAGLPLNQL